MTESGAGGTITPVLVVLLLAIPIGSVAVAHRAPPLERVGFAIRVGIALVFVGLQWAALLNDWLIEFVRGGTDVSMGPAIVLSGFLLITSLGAFYLLLYWSARRLSHIGWSQWWALAIPVWLLFIYYMARLNSNLVEDLTWEPMYPIAAWVLTLAALPGARAGDQ